MKNTASPSFTFILLMALLMSLVALAINMLLPAFQAISLDMGLTNITSVQQTVSLLYLGLSFGQVLLGVLSDSIGRQKTMLAGLSIFLSGVILSLLSTHFSWLLVGQFLQGLGLGAPRVVTMAIVRDQYEGNTMGKIVSFFMVIFMFVPIVSPYLGQSILLVSHWRMLFLVYLVIGLMLLLAVRFFLKESLPANRRTPFSSKYVTQALYSIFKQPATLGYIGILGMYSGVYIAYMNLSQQLFEIQYQLGEDYPAYFALLAVSIALASYTNGKLVEKHGMFALSSTAIVLSIVASFLPLAISPLPFSLFMAGLFIQLFCFGILIGNLNTLALAPLGKTAGLGVALIGSLSTLVAVPISVYVGGLYIDSATPIFGGFLVSGVLSLGIILVQHQKRKKHSLQHADRQVITRKL